MTGRGEKRSLRLFDRGVVRNVLARRREGIAEAAQHAAHIAVCRGGVREILIVPHVLGFDARDAAQLRIDDKRRKAIARAVRIQKISCRLLLH